MNLTPGGDNPDVEDRRDEGGGGGYGFGGGGFGGGGFGGIHLGIGGTLILLVLSFLFKTNLFQFLGGGGGPVNEPARIESRAPNSSRNLSEQPKVQFVKDVLGNIQDTWDKQLPEQTKRPYRHAKLDLFRDEIQSGCGMAQSATGPFYCPEDEKVYLDLGFFDELKGRFGAPGDFAQAYVIAHEVGHHVQKILGIEGQVQQAEQRNPAMQNQYSVGLELQADCFAGVWANHTVNPDLINQSDISDGLRAAAAVGDDRLQKMARGRVSPETFTHGSSAQRQKWFNTGYTQGTIEACNTFASR